MGTVLNASDYTATWTHVSGPGTSTFSATVNGITTASFPTYGTYRIQLEVIKDSYTLTEPIDVYYLPPPPSGYVTGLVNYQVYKNIAGTLLSDFTNHAKYPDSPDLTEKITRLEGLYSDENFGSRIYGYIIPPVSGDYTFYIAADDVGEFKLGADEASATKICEVTQWTGQYEWTKYSSQTSSVQSLVAGTPYFFEVTHKESTGGDNLAIAWTGPGIGTPSVIPGEFLALPGEGAITITSHPTDINTTLGSDVAMNIQVSGQGPFLYEWTLDGVSYWPTSSNSSLPLSNVSAGSSGTYRCIVTNEFGSVTSNFATLTMTDGGNTIAGGLWREVYSDIPGILVSDLVNHNKYPKFPDFSEVITSSETLAQDGDDNGQRWTGWVIPDTSGEHTFYVAADDTAEIWLSTDENEYNKVKIATLPSWVDVKLWSSGGVSAPISLVAGNRYYIEVRHKVGGGYVHCAVNWRKPGDPVPTDGAGSIPDQNLEYRHGGIHVTTTVISLALANPTTNNVRIRLGMGLDMEVIATPAPDSNDTIVWTMESGTGTVTFENPNSLSTGATFSSEGSYILRCTVDNGGAPATTDVNVTVTSEALASWVSASIAEPASGSGTVNTDTSFTVLGSGADIKKNSDNCQLFHQDLTGDFDVRARVVSKITGSFGMHAQLMARESNNPNSRNIAMTHEKTETVAFQYRTTAGENTTYRSARNLGLPLWIRLVRSGGTGSAGQTFTGYYSVDDGATWTQRETVTYTTPMPETLMVGFAVSSGGTSLNTVNYDNVSGFKISPNHGVIVDAGGNDTVDITTVANLSSTVSDDAKPTTPGSITTTWVQVSGPGTTTFGDASASTTTASFDQLGQYTLRQYATDGEVTTYDDLTVDVTTTVMVDIAVTDSEASEVGPDPGTFTLTRSGPTADALTVNLSIGGTATNGSDYTSITTAVQIPAGSATALITIQPLLDGDVEETESVEFTVIQGIYNIENAVATVMIENHPDSDSDGLSDVWEVTHFGDLTSSNGSGDTDNDGLSDAFEFTASTNPNNTDSDADGFSDFLEINQSTDPNDDTSTPNALYRNLVAWWKLDDGSGTTAMDSTGGNHGTVNGSSWITGIDNGALFLNGSSDQITCSNTSVPGQMTITAWIKPSSLTDNHGIVSKDGSFAMKTSNGELTFTTPGIMDHTSSGAGLTPGIWQHIAITFDPNQTDGIRYYLNGSLVDQSDASAYVDGVGDIQIGNNQYANQYYHGGLDDIRIYQTILNATELTDLYSSYPPNVTSVPDGINLARPINVTQESGSVATQSTTAWGGVPERAIDGNTDGVWGNGSVTHTDDAASGAVWWQVDLGNDQLINTVTLFNRALYQSRLSNFTVTILDASSSVVASQSFYVGSGSVGDSETWSLTSAVIGRVVRVELINGLNNDGNSSLSLAEVQVFSAGGVASQSTILAEGDPDRAIDGNTDGVWDNGSTTHTDTTSENWWEVDLQQFAVIEQLDLYNRTDSNLGERLSNFRVTLWQGSTLVYSSDHFTQSGTYAGALYSIVDVDGIVADRVRIESLGTNSSGDRIISLAEVEVYGETLSSANPDTDNDTLKDHWELSYYGNLGLVAATSDTDGDGFTAFQEMVFGMNPTVNDSSLAPIQDQIVDAGGSDKLEVKFRRPQNFRLLNMTYKLQSSHDLGAGSWVDVTSITPTITLDGGNEWVIYLMPLPSGAETRVFYRCQVSPTP